MYTQGDNVRIGRQNKFTLNQRSLLRDGQGLIEERVEALAGMGEKMAYVTLHDVEYILGTGRNWKGTTGKFTLRIRKDSAEQIVSLCFPGKPRKADAELLEFVQEDFVPQDKLVVYFYDVAPDVPGSGNAR